MLSLSPKFSNSIVPIIWMVMFTFGLVELPIGLQADTPKVLTTSPTQAIVSKFIELLKSPVLPNTKPLQIKEQSNNHMFGDKSAKMLEEVLRKKIVYKDFRYVAFSLGKPTPDSWASLYVFEIANAKQAQKLLGDHPKTEGGIRGLLPTKAPQQYEALIIDNMLCALVVERWQPDELTKALFSAFRSLRASPPKE